MSALPASYREFGPVLSGTLASGPVGVCWQDGEFYAVRPLEWPEAARLLRELAEAPDAEAPDGEPWGSVVEQFIMECDIHADGGPLPCAGVYQAYLEWHAENPPTPEPLDSEGFARHMERSGFVVNQTRFGSYFQEGYAALCLEGAPA